jgi:hypothetical protein
MSSNTPFDDVQQELEGLSPLLASMREQKQIEESSSVDMDMLHNLGNAALQAVPLEEPSKQSPAPTMRVVHRGWSTMKIAAAAAVALLVGALLSYSIVSEYTADAGYVSANQEISAELVASFEEETADPIAFLLDDESYVYDDNEIAFSPLEDVLLDWADDGNVDEVLSEELIFAALR